MSPDASELLSLWRRRDSGNTAPTARVCLRLPDGARLQRDLRINYNMSEIRALLADEIQFDPEQLDICGPEPATEPVPDSLVLAGLDAERRQLTLHVRLRDEPRSARAAPQELRQHKKAAHEAKGATGCSFASGLALGVQRSEAIRTR